TSCSIPCNTLHKVTHESETGKTRPTVNSGPNVVQQSTDRDGTVIIQTAQLTALTALDTHPAYIQLLNDYTSLKSYLRPIYETTEEAHARYNDDAPRKN